MLHVGLPVGGVLGGQRLIPDDQHVLRVVFLRGLREVEAAGDDRVASSITLTLLWATPGLGISRDNAPKTVLAASGGNRRDIDL